MRSSYLGAAATLGWLCAALMMTPGVATATDGSGDSDGNQPHGPDAAASKPTTRLPGIKVTARRPRLTAPDVAKQRERLDRNLNGERYVTDISTVADARTGTTQIFYPGMGRSVFGGVRYGFGDRS